MGSETVVSLVLIWVAWSWYAMISSASMHSPAWNTVGSGTHCGSGLCICLKCSKWSRGLQLGQDLLSWSTPCLALVLLPGVHLNRLIFTHEISKYLKTVFILSSPTRQGKALPVSSTWALQGVCLCGWWPWQLLLWTCSRYVPLPYRDAHRMHQNSRYGLLDDTGDLPPWCSYHKCSQLLYLT